MKYLLISLSLCFLLLQVACWSDKGKKIPDVSHIEVVVNINRFDQALFAVDTNNLAEAVPALQEEYPDYLNFYTRQILRDPRPVEAVVPNFIQDASIQQLYDTCMIVYGAVEDLEADFAKAFQYYKYYFPERKVPTIMANISAMNYGAFTYGADTLGLSWEFYLGKDFPMYHPNLFPVYLKRSMNKAHLVAKSIKALVQNMMDDSKKNTLLDHMVYNGKVLYLMEQLLPHTPDSIIMEYTEEQLAWSEDNELQTWTYLIGDDLLYSTRTKDFQKLVFPSPTGTAKMPAESPGRAANWIGKQIVSRFMERFPNKSLADLIAFDDAQKLLESSKYKPKR